MAFIYASCALGAICLISFLVNFNKKRTVIGVFNKMTVSIFFIMTAFFGILHSMDKIGDPSIIKYGLLVLIGLVFGMLGDIYLDQKWVYPNDEKKYLYAGFITFAIGHIFYITALAVKAQLKFVYVLLGACVGLLVVIVNIFIEKFTTQNFGEYRFIVMLYSLLVGTTPGVALVATIMTHGEPAFIVFLIGAVFFLLSDIVLSPMYFSKGKNTPVNFVINHVTYYIGQYMFALSIIFLK
ncbi:MAG: lysoplasmalogenase [Acutalibacteraceae bacterium]|nr:lysoplasmalogenase [Oscillospiraceae bacterium]